VAGGANGSAESENRTAKRVYRTSEHVNKSSERVYRSAERLYRLAKRVYRLSESVYGTSESVYKLSENKNGMAEHVYKSSERSYKSSESENKWAESVNKSSERSYKSAETEHGSCECIRSDPPDFDGLIVGRPLSPENSSRMRIIDHARSVFPMLLLLVGATTVPATTIDPLTWQELVVGSDFLGVIECEVAGGIVAKYKVVDSWKGPANGEVVSLRIAVDAWGPQFPIALCGERLLVAAYKSPPSTMMSTTSYGPIPLWWRQIPADFETPLFQGFARTDARKSLLDAFESEHSSLGAFKRDAMKLLEQSPEKQEERLLRARVEKFATRGDESSDDEEKKWSKALWKSVRQTKSSPELVELLMAEANRSEDARDRIARILVQGGGELTIAAIEKLTASKSAPNQKEWKRIAEDIRRRLGRGKEKLEHHDKKSKPPANGQLVHLRAMLNKPAPNQELDDALEILSVHDPEPVADYLAKWVNPNKDWRDQDLGYSLGSYFAWRCGRNRKQNLVKLLSAKDDFVRVAGAVYLCFEDRELGLQKLEELSRLDGDPGVWAALNRVRRGDKSAMPRALEVLKTVGELNMAGVQHCNLQKRLIVLLSNTAEASGLKQPRPQAVEMDNEGQQSKIYQSYQSWWKANADKATITDPWLPILEKQKVD
jgi:hypothetical protein